MADGAVLYGLMIVDDTTHVLDIIVINSIFVGCTSDVPASVCSDVGFLTNIDLDIFFFFLGVIEWSWTRCS
jgi:hypothetical protein